MPRPFELTQQEAADVAKSVASMIDRICDGTSETVCYALNKTDEHGRRLIVAITVDPGLTLEDFVKRYGAFKRAQQQESPCPKTTATPS